MSHRTDSAQRVTKERENWILMLACLGFLACCLAVYGIMSVTPDHSGTAYILIHLLMTGAMLLAWRCGACTRPQLILLTGIVARLLLIPAPMLSSNDAERYLWDGAVALSGLDPYAFPPADPAVAGLRAIWATPPEHAAYPTLYPPAALGLFAFSALMGPVSGIWFWKLLVSLCGIAQLLLADRLLRRHGLGRHLALVALSPLLVLETGVGAHLDMVVALIITASLAAFYAKRFGWVGGLLGLGICVKLLPAAILLAMAAAVGWRQGARMIMIASASVAVIYGMALSIGWRPIGSLPVFFEKWRNGSPLFTLLEAQFSGPNLLAVTGALALMAVVVILLFARKRPIIGAQIALATPLVLSPVAFPWYLCPLVPLAAIVPNATLLIWFTTSPLVYEVRDRFVSDGVWMPALWPLMVIGAGWGLGAAIDAIGRFRKQVSRRWEDECNPSIG